MLLGNLPNYMLTVAIDVHLSHLYRSHLYLDWCYHLHIALKTFESNLCVFHCLYMELSSIWLTPSSPLT